MKLEINLNLSPSEKCVCVRPSATERVRARARAHSRLPVQTRELAMSDVVPAIDLRQTLGIGLYTRAPCSTKSPAGGGSLSINIHIVYHLRVTHTQSAGGGVGGGVRGNVVGVGSVWRTMKVLLPSPTVPPLLLHTTSNFPFVDQFSFGGYGCVCVCATSMSMRVDGKTQQGRAHDLNRVTCGQTCVRYI